MKSNLIIPSFRPAFEGYVVIRKNTEKLKKKDKFDVSSILHIEQS